MEKSDNKKSKYIFSRLLKFVLVYIFLSSIFTFNCFGISVSQNFKSMKFIPVSNEQDDFFVQNEIHYEVVIPELSSSDVQVDIGSLPENVEFIFSRKSNFIQNQKTALKIEYWFKFSIPGKYILPTAKLEFHKKKYYIPFEPIVIHENIQNIFPEMIIHFKASTDESVRIANDIIINKKDDITSVSLPCGKKLEFSVSVIHAVRILSFNWVLPKNSFFTEIQKTDIDSNQQVSRTFSDTELPVAVFEWEPIVEGVYEIPQISIKAIAYNGSTIELDEPLYKLIATSYITDTDVLSKKSDLYINAFTTASKKIKTTEKEKITFADLKKIVLLRQNERNSLPCSNVERKRKLYEKSLGINSSLNETSFPLSIVFCILICIGIAFFIIFFRLKKNHLATFFSIVTFLSVAFLIYNGVKLAQQYGIVIGGNLSTIPEKESTSDSSLRQGVRVRITEEVGEWLYVEDNNSGGWILRKNVLFIH